MYLEHYKGSFGDIWMWSPIVTSPLVSAAGLAGAALAGARRARSLPVAGALYALNGAIGTYTHLRGVVAQAGRLLRADLQPGHGPAAAGTGFADPGRRARACWLRSSSESASRCRTSASRSPSQPARGPRRRLRPSRAAASASRPHAADARPLPRLRRARAGRPLGRGHPQDGAGPRRECAAAAVLQSDAKRPR